MEGLGLRWMSSEDIGAVNSISEKSGIKISIAKAAKRPKIICVVSEISRVVNGFILYSLGSDRIAIKQLAVDPGFRREGVATSLVSRLFSKMNAKRRVLEAKVSEYDLISQLFFRSLSFRAEETERHEGDDQYLFRRHF